MTDANAGRDSSSSTLPVQPRRQPFLTHERSVHVFAALADFAERYPDLCEGDKAMYRDLCRAAMVSLGEEQRAEEMLLARGVEAVLFRVCREGVGARLLRQVREAGLSVRLNGDTLHVGPKEKVTAAIRQRVGNWKYAIRDALLTEGLSDPELCKRA